MLFHYLSTGYLKTPRIVLLKLRPPNKVKADNKSEVSVVAQPCLLGMSARSYLVYDLYFKNFDVICILFKDNGLCTNKVGTGFRKLKKKDT